MKKLAFTVSRELKTDLTRQVADGLRQAILAGYYRAGDALPSFEKMAGLLGVSEIVTRRAVQSLAREGLVASRPRIGIRVCGTMDKGWQGQVLYLHRARHDIYYHSMFSAELEEGLLSANYLVRRVFVSDEEARAGFPRVKLEMAYHNALVIVEGRVLCGLDRFLKKAGVPFLHIGSKVSPDASWGIVQRRSAALPALLEHCRACGIRRVMQVNLCVEEELNAASALRAAGCRVSCRTIKPAAGHALPEAAEFGAFAFFAAFAKSHQKAWPDLLLFDDDYLARGGLHALSLAGLRLPEDVQAISWSNMGMTPGYDRMLTRIEMDGCEHGRLMAKAAIEILEGKAQEGRAAQEVAPRFVPGETTVPKQEE